MSVFDDVHVISKHLNPIPLAELEEVELALGTKFPIGYRDFITRFGEGVYCDLWRIYPPKRILNEYLMVRGRWRRAYYEYEGIKHWFFEGSEPVLNPEQLQESFVIGDSLDGDEIVFYPLIHDKLFILPRHKNAIDIIQADFTDLHIWDAEKPMVKSFQSFVSLQKQFKLSLHSENHSFTQENVLDTFLQKWPELVVSASGKGLTNWSVIVFVASIGARIQIYYDYGSGTYEDEHRKVTIKGNQKPRLSFQVACNEDSASEVQAFFDSLQAQNLIRFD